MLSDHSVKKEKQQYNAIDLVKFLCSIMVVMIHIAPFGTNSKYVFLNYMIQNCVTRIGVPFFFVASGFFLYKKSTYKNFNLKPSKEYVMKIFRLYIVWTIIYLPFSIIALLKEEKGILFGTLCYIRNFLLVGSYSHLWYLNALIVGVMIVSFLLYKKCKIKNIIITAMFFYILGLLAQSWFGLIRPLKSYIPQIWMLLKVLQNIMATTRNGLFEGFLFIGIGMLFAFYTIKIDMKKAIWGFAISYVILFFEVLFVNHAHLIRSQDMYIFLVPTTFFMFYITQNIKLKENKIYLVLRQLSSLIFYMHLWIGKVTSKICAILFHINIGESSLMFIITVSVTIVAALTIIKLSRYKYFHWLQKLYV